MQLLMDLLAVTSTYVLLGHSEHAVYPVVFLYKPLAHAVHAKPSWPATDDVYPVLHLQASNDALPLTACELVLQSRQSVCIVRAIAAEYVSVGQFAHGVDPLSDLYLPAAQYWHVPPFGPVYPGTHLQSSSTAAPTAEIAFCGHMLH